MLLWLQLALAFYLTGLIWVVQLILYPAFSRIAADQFVEFHQLHSQRITWIVAPPMVLEMVIAGVWLAMAPNALTVVNLASVVSLWAFTFFVSVPLHQRLIMNPKDHEAMAALVITNWPRTVVWTLRAVFLIFWAIHLYAL